ncbi:MAG: GNAT family N-acetyltransferase [Alphaproteobacteria bacterium]|nr:GNAT family N-acetyltransferase [Alphaproteobacteria bacterium]
MLLKTARLILRPQLPPDATPLFAILSDPQAMRFWSRPALTELAVAEELVREQQAAMASGICRYWTLLENRQAIGSIDLSLIKDGSAELGFLLRPDRWDQGLASEALEAVIAHAFGPLDLMRLAAAVQAENRAAARVLEKNGFSQVQQRAVVLPGGESRVCGFYLLKR